MLTERVFWFVAAHVEKQAVKLALSLQLTFTDPPFVPAAAAALSCCLQHYAQCELLPRDDEIADKSLQTQFAVHQAA
jgi:hypothetical protein